MSTRRAHAPARELVLLYCGADQSWADLQATGFRRRNTCLLRAFGAQQDIRRVGVIRLVSRSAFLASLITSRADRHDDERVQDVGVAFVLPASWNAPLARWINGRLARWQISRQIGPVTA